MSKRRRSGRNRNKDDQQQKRKVEFWRLSAPLPDGPPAVFTEDPSATLLSLGHPPLPGQPDAQKHIVLVAARASAVATALAAAATIHDASAPPSNEASAPPSNGDPQPG